MSIKIDSTNIEYVNSIAREIGESGAASVMKKITIKYSNASGGVPIIQMREYSNSPWVDLSNTNNLYTVSSNGTSGTIVFNVYKYFNSSYQGSGTPEWRLKSGNEVSFGGTLLAPGKLPLTLGFTIQNDAINKFANSKYFKNGITVTIPALGAAIGEKINLNFIPHLTQIKIQAIENGIEKEVNTTTSIVYGASKSYAVGSRVSGTCTIKITITDALERNWVYDCGNYTKIDKLEPSGSISMNPSNIKPYSNKSDVNISLPSFNIPSSGGLHFAYSFSYGSYKEEFSEDLTTRKNRFTMSADTFRNKIINLFKKVIGSEKINNSYTVGLQLTISNGFENKYFSNSFTVDFVEQPIMESTSTDLKYGNEDVQSGMKFNANETIKFVSPTVSDYNNDIVSYEIGWTHNADDDDIASTNIKQIQLGQRLEYIVPAVSSTIDRYFAIRAKDSKGNTSLWSPYSHRTIIGRTNLPDFLIKNLSTEADKNNNKHTLLKFDIEINDFGGDFRQQGETQIKIELGSSINFTNSKTITYSSSSNEVKFEVERAETMYARFTLTTYYGQEGGKVSKTSQIFTIGKLPTVVYRPNRIGINTTNLEENSSLTIQTYGQYEKITLRADEKDSIEINLAKRTIDGLTITCGSW